MTETAWTIPPRTRKRTSIGRQQTSQSTMRSPTVSSGSTSNAIGSPQCGQSSFLTSSTVSPLVSRGSAPPQRTTAPHLARLGPSRPPSLPGLSGTRQAPIMGRTAFKEQRRSARAAPAAFSRHLRPHPRARAHPDDSPPAAGVYTRARHGQGGSREGPRYEPPGAPPVRDRGPLRGRRGPGRHGGQVPPRGRIEPARRLRPHQPQRGLHLQLAHRAVQPRQSPEPRPSAHPQAPAPQERDPQADRRHAHGGSLAHPAAGLPEGRPYQAGAGARPRAQDPRQARGDQEEGNEARSGPRARIPGAGGVRARRVELRRRDYSDGAPPVAASWAARTLPASNLRAAASILSSVASKSGFVVPR